MMTNGVLFILVCIRCAYHFFLSFSREKGSNENVKKDDEEKGNEENEGIVCKFG